MGIELCCLKCSHNICSGGTREHPHFPVPTGNTGGWKPPRQSFAVPLPFFIWVKIPFQTLHRELQGKTILSRQKHNHLQLRLWQTSSFPSPSNNNPDSESPKHFSFSIWSGHRESREEKLILNIWKQTLHILVQYNWCLQPPWVWLKPRLCYCWVGAHPSVKCPEFSHKVILNAVTIFLIAPLKGFRDDFKGIWAFHKWMRSAWHVRLQETRLPHIQYICT